MSDFKKSNKNSELVGEVPTLYSIFKGQVASIQPYGVFIKIPGCSKNGLVHRSQISNTAIDKLEEVVEVGEKVYCKVISAEPDGAKIALSMKVVNQTTGKDLDPALVQTSLDEKHRKTVNKTGSRRIELDAIYDTTCKKCGGKGHLSQDCFYRPGDAKYDLLQEEPDEPTTNTIQNDSPHKSHKKHKKHKKKSLKKDKHEMSTHSDDMRSHLTHEVGGKRDEKHRRCSKSSSEFDERHLPSKKPQSVDTKHRKRESNRTDFTADGERRSSSSRKRSRSRSSSLSRKNRRQSPLRSNQDVRRTNQSEPKER